MRDSGGGNGAARWCEGWPAAQRAWRAWPMRCAGITRGLRRAAAAGEGGAARDAVRSLRRTSLGTYALHEARRKHSAQHQQLMCVVRPAMSAHVGAAAQPATRTWQAWGRAARRAKACVGSCVALVASGSARRGGRAARRAGGGG